MSIQQRKARKWLWRHLVQLDFQSLKAALIWSKANYAIRRVPLNLCPSMLIWWSVFLEERRKKKGEKMHECRGMLFENKEAFKTGSHACAKLGEVEVIVLIYTIMHVFCSVRNRPVLESQPHISHWRAFNSLAAWWMKQQRLQCSNGKDMGKETELS